MMKKRKGEQPLAMMKMEVKTKVIVIVTVAAMIVDMTMITATPIVMTTIEVMIAYTVEMIEVNPLVMEKTKMQIYSDYYDQDIEDDAEANRWSDIDSDQYRLIIVLENARVENAQANQMYHDEYPYGHLLDLSDITNVSSRSDPRYDKHGREVPKLGSYYDLEPSSPNPTYRRGG